MGVCFLFPCLVFVGVNFWCGGGVSTAHYGLGGGYSLYSR